MVYYLSNAPIAQGIEHRSPEPGAKVRILLGAPLKKRFHSHVRPLFFCLDVRFGREWQGNACACEMNRTDSVKPDLKKV